MEQGKDITEYRDSFFRGYFKDKGRLVQVYQALTGDSSVRQQDIVITDLEGTLGSRIRNDVSFCAGEQEIVLLEHQSTMNLNMPLRCFFYLSRLWWLGMEKRLLYDRKLQRVPAPIFAVLYNGRAKLASGHEQWKLSEAFIGKARNLELIVDVYNINYGKLDKTFTACQPMKEYSEFVADVQRSISQGYSADMAVRMTVQECIKKNVMKDFLLEHETEVNTLLSWGYDEALAKQVAREEGLEEGRVEAREGMAVTMIKKGTSKEFIADVTQLPMWKINELGKVHGLL